MNTRSFHLIIICFCISLFSTFTVKGQDPHFSQFFTSPFILNPALAGTGPGTYRVNVNYRDQWRSAIENSLRTFAFSGDLKYELNDKQKYPDIGGFGFLFFGDRVSAFDLNTNQLALIGSFHKSLSQRKKQYIGGGIQIGLHQKSINYEDLQFGDQFNGLDGYTFESAELLPSNNHAFLDLVAGLNYSTETNSGHTYVAGISFAHFSNPNISFYQDDLNPNPDLVKEDILFAKTTGYVSASYFVNEKLDVEPRVMFLKQGNHQEINVGSNFKFKFPQSEGRNFHIGPWIRGVQNENGFGIESIIASVGIEINSFLIGLSYDHNLLDLANERSGLNALELSITFLGDYENEDSFCPKF